MTNKDKVIAAFLVSAGLFSLSNATQYVKNLSLDQREGFCLLASADTGAVEVSEPARIPVQNNRQG